jgi:hypothetical protein
METMLDLRPMFAERDELRAENARLVAALDIARTALLTIERKCEEARAELSRISRR